MESSIVLFTIVFTDETKKFKAANSCSPFFVRFLWVLQFNFLPYIRKEEGPKRQIKPQKMHLMIHVSCVVAEISGKFMRRMRLNLRLSVVEKLFLELWRLVGQVREALPKRVLVKISGAEMIQEIRG